MKHCFLVTGPNCSGKTTTVARVLERFNPGQDSIVSIGADNDSMFKGEATEQEAALVDLWKHDVQVLIIEGTRINTPLMRVAKRFPQDRQLHVLMTTQTPPVMRQHLIDRCAKRNKVFRAEYWTDQKLSYEGQKRYPNSFAKNGVRYKTYTIDPGYTVCQTLADDLVMAIQFALGRDCGYE